MLTAIRMFTKAIFTVSKMSSLEDTHLACSFINPEKVPIDLKTFGCPLPSPPPYMTLEFFPILFYAYPFFRTCLWPGYLVHLYLSPIIFCYLMQKSTNK